MKGDLLQRSPEEEALFQKAARGEASAGEHEAFRRWQLERVEQLLAADAGALLEIAEVSPQVPEKARIFKSQRCTRCGEMVMEPRARIREGQVVCIPCSESYARGWGNTTG
jgi:formylmethanofuran dehydrogenase subunit E